VSGNNNPGITEKPPVSSKKTALNGCKILGNTVKVQLETSANRRAILVNSNKSNWKVDSSVLGAFCTKEATSRIVLVSKSKLWRKEGRRITDFRIVSKYSSSSKPRFTSFPKLDN
jgi:hypothetical protein